MSKRNRRRHHHPSTYKLGDHPSCANHTTTPLDPYWQQRLARKEQSERDLKRNEEKNSEQRSG